MAISLISNASSLRAANTLRKTHQTAAQSMKRISSGTRLIDAASDAAGGSISSKLKTRVGSTQQAIRNVNDGISIVQTAEAATKEVVSILDRMRELAVQSASETLATTERGYINTEFEQLSEEVERISATTEFNDIKLADGTNTCLLYTSPSPRDKRQSRMPSSA